jgi:hypothetical protein
MNKKGATEIKIKLKNSFEMITLQKNVTIVDITYENPNLDIVQRSPFFYEPTERKKSVLFTVVSITNLPNIKNAANTKGWSIFSVNSFNLKIYR